MAIELGSGDKLVLLAEGLDQLDIGLNHRGDALDLAAHVLDQDVSHAATRRGQRHLDVDPSRSFTIRRHVTLVDQPQLDHVDRDFRIKTGTQLFPHQLFDGFVAGAFVQPGGRASKRTSGPPLPVTFT